MNTTTETKRTAQSEWYARPTAGHETHGQCAIYSDEGRTLALTYDDPGCARAAFIVRACNVHDDLVAALQTIADAGERGELAIADIHSIKSVAHKALAKAQSDNT